MNKQDELLRTDEEYELSNIIAPYFKDPIEDPCPCCEAAKAIMKAGFRKQPSSPPPVLSDEKLENILEEYSQILGEQFNPLVLYVMAGVAQTQIDLLKKKGYL